MTTGGLGGLLRWHAERSPSGVFATCGAETWTFGELNSVTDSVAAGLAQLGLAKGDRAVVIAPNRPEMLELYFALAKIGVVQVPLNPFLKGEFLRYQLSNVEPQLLVVDREGLQASAGMFGGVPSLRAIVTLDESIDVVIPDSIDVRPYRSLQDAHAEPPMVEITDDDIMSIVYTSGTTGMPKGCLLSHGYYQRCGRQMARANAIIESDVLFTALPLFHTAARAMVVAAAAVAGARVVIEQEFSASGYFRRATEVGATLAYGVGATAMALLKSAPSPHDRSHNVRAMLAPPMPVAAQLEFRERFGFPAWTESYGQTECTPISNTLSDRQTHPGSAGRPVPDVEVMLLDENDRPVSTGSRGEICVRPLEDHALFSGYWRRPDIPVPSVGGVWHHTGDVGYVDDEGYLWFLDRKRDVIRRRGENVSSAELEAAIGRIPGIRDVAVHPVPDDLGEGDDIKAVIVADADADFDPASLFDHFRIALPYFAIPRYVEIVEELPRNAMGRLMKFELRERPLTSGVWDLHALGLTVARSERR